MKDLHLAGIKASRTVLDLAGATLGGREVMLMGGPCAVESAAQMYQAAQTVSECGGKVLRGGVFKPRTSPYSFQGLGQQGIQYLVEAAHAHGLLAATEVIDPESLNLVAAEVDIIQIGARNMQNFQLLKLAGKTDLPVILKRGLAATVEEWLMAAEYILASGNPRVILCERGNRTFETTTRNTLDLGAMLVAKGLSHLPVIVDPSHAAGRTDIIPGLAKAAVAAGADGLLIEMHPNPAEAKSDGPQSLTPEQFKLLATELVAVAHSVQRSFAGPVHGNTLAALRARIDIVDIALVDLIAQRMQLVQHIGWAKGKGTIQDSAREASIIQRLRHAAQNMDCSPELIEDLYSQIFAHSVQIQAEIGAKGPVSVSKTEDNVRKGELNICSA